ncbi:MAG TPA: hypothetical protein ENJ28_10945 [Gammaproteobacteria bacterium]|nr:hypothetical protein [Gammaproteobacteria bacterium]
MVKSKSHRFFTVSFAFILFTIIGTLTHELGHITVAKLLGYETRLHYESMSWDKGMLLNELNTIYAEYQNPAELPPAIKIQYEEVKRRLAQDSFLITIGGLLQTIVTGLIGLVYLIFRRKKIAVTGLNIRDWLAVFLALFWLREPFNLVFSIGGGLYSGENYFGSGDEVNISQMLNIPVGIIPSVLGALGLLISCFVIFEIIPAGKRLDFILGGLFGGISGYILWMKILGPILLP